MLHLFGLLISIVLVVFGIQAWISEGIRLWGDLADIPGNRTYIFPGFISFFSGIVLFVVSVTDGYIKENKLMRFLLSIFIRVCRKLNALFYSVMDMVYVAFPYSLKKTYRFIRLKNWAMNKYEAGDFDGALSMADELLLSSDDFEDNWNYGNAIHWGHTVRGLIFYRNGEFNSAKEELFLSANVRPSPQLQAFGPKMNLAELCREKFGDKVVEKFLKKFKKSMKSE